ncbi:leucine-rich repeat domain-containing protein [Listeria ilorinensis]|uniref:leucine-rich repeat domain-containing protein n=1 Tax=Listeria ilorinensis TaxID=2867439 RepID=UPI001EF59AA5|nr:leucine-rich repeat domain-containing protein [Listeria ilorinensis]
MKKIFITVLVGALFVAMSVPAAAAEESSTTTTLKEENVQVAETEETDTNTSEETNVSTVVTEELDTPEAQDASVAENSKVDFSLKASADEVNIPDPALRKSITQALGKSDDAVVTEEDMKLITKINNTSTTVNSLEGLQYATNLKELGLYNYSGASAINDLSPISQLTMLENLYLENAAISDITPISGLTNLTSLSLAGNKIQDISIVANFTKLTYLGLSENLIENIDALAQLTNLTSLQMNGASVNSIGEPGKTGNAISDLTSLSNLTNLKYLSLCGYDDALTDISPLAGLVNLKTLNIFDNKIADVSVIENMTNLGTLQMDDNAIKNLPDMSKLTSLYWLGVRNNPLTNQAVEQIGGIGGSLQNLLLGYEGWSFAPDVDNIEPLANLTSLSYLHLCGTSVADLSPLSNLPLTSALLYSNKIADVSPLAGKQMRELNLNNNQITDISSLDLSAINYFIAHNQNVALEDGYQNAPTAVSIAESSGAVPGLTWTTAGNYTNGTLAWDNPGANQVNFASADGLFTGTIKQQVNAGDPPILTSSIVVKYVDEEGNELESADTYTGNVGDSQTIEAKAIAGYTLKEGQTSPQTLTYTTDAQTIEYVYVADPAPATDSTITVKYMDENGLELTSSDMYTGKIGEQETIQAKDIAGYVLKEGQTNPQNMIYTSENQTVTFIYVSSATPANNDADAPTPSQPIADGSTSQQIAPATKTNSVINSTVTSLPKTGDTPATFIWIGLVLMVLGGYGLRKRWTENHK